MKKTYTKGPGQNMAGQGYGLGWRSDGWDDVER